MLQTTRQQASPRPSWLLIAGCLSAVYIIWGTTYYAIKVGIEGAAPFFLVGTRFLLAGGILVAWQALRGRPMPTAKQWRGAALLGFLLLVVGNGGVAVAERWVSSGATVALISVMPLATALWSGAFGRWPRRMEWGAIALGGLGAAVMLMGRDLQGSVAGTLVILLGTTCWSLGTVLARRIDIPHGPTGFGAEMLAAGVLALVMSALLGEHWALPHTPRVWWAWIYLVVFGSLIAFSAYRFVVERVSPTLASTYAYVNPPVALFVGWRLGDESFSSNTLLGLPIVLSAVALHAWVQARERSDPPQIPVRVPMIQADAVRQNP
ncbi:MAG TPA: drug/metabolite exporter YedA [Steroidobacteraceae bacterium]|jgi:drug/metabolite transporter (DMT)-like permease|nr:drug/metabolite exporter YedA [Steroidobacteraceae bacterium]